MDINSLYEYFNESSGICTDTRQIKKGCLFFALTGDKFNGNLFAQEALDKGARFAIVDDPEFHKSTGETILVRNSLTALQELAQFHRKQLGIPIIALTGSNGKTTTKELINAVLSQKYDTTATLGNLNNHIGVPLTILSMSSDTEIGIVEMGANHVGEIELLSEITLPDYGYITNFGKAHLEGFGSLDGVVKGKTELYNFLRKANKEIFVNADDSTQMQNSEGIKRITFGTEDSNYIITTIENSKQLRVQYKGIDIQSNLVGHYNFPNIAAAIAIGAYFDVPPLQIKNGIESYTPTNNRSQLLKKGTNTILMDAYNANPSSMMVALDNFKNLEDTQKILILGDMFELGVDAAGEHQTIVDYLSDETLGKTYLVGINFFETKVDDENICRFKTVENLKKELKSNPPQNATILIKASRGMELEKIVEFL